MNAVNSHMSAVDGMRDRVRVGDVRRHYAGDCGGRAAGRKQKGGEATISHDLRLDALEQRNS
ncbi:MAG: hypothetical protein IH587_08655 [Anaerolineae bacterium]|nr:hypothetical protein [Anaerolineae bacterium]